MRGLSSECRQVMCGRPSLYCPLHTSVPANCTVHKHLRETIDIFRRFLTSGDPLNQQKLKTGHSNRQERL